MEAGQCIAAVECAQNLLRQEFSEIGEWPRWYALVTLLYAGELALNQSGLTISIDERIDSRSTLKKKIDDVFTVHCWHVEEYFSKHQYARGEYADRETPLNIESIGDYALLCMRLAETVDLENPSATTPAVYTPAQAVRMAGSLLCQALPKLPAQIKRKYFG